MIDELLAILLAIEFPAAYRLGLLAVAEVPVPEPGWQLSLGIVVDETGRPFHQWQVFVPFSAVQATTEPLDQLGVSIQAMVDATIAESSPLVVRPAILLPNGERPITKPNGVVRP